MPDDAQGYLGPEAQARIEIDRQLVKCGWVIQDYEAANLYASSGVATAAPSESAASTTARGMSRRAANVSITGG
jgi:hypothetical protein